MTDIEKAKSLIKDNADYTIVLVKDELIYHSTKRGVLPMLEFIDSGVNLNGFSVADRVVGKASAMLFSLVGIKEVYSPVLSRLAADFLSKDGIKYSADTLCEKIINRRGDGTCPMENAVADTESPERAYELIVETHNMLRVINK